jgi:hypothetical protein
LTEKKGMTIADKVERERKERLEEKERSEYS